MVSLRALTAPLFRTAAQSRSHRAGRTRYVAALGSPYVLFTAGADQVLSPGETVSVVLRYRPGVLTGPGEP
jgi:hypothetical protein